MNTPSLEPITLTPLGFVESLFRSVSDFSDYKSESRIRVRPDLLPALTGIEYFSHLWVIYHQHRSREWLQEKHWGEEPPLILPDCDDRAGQGVFSSRAPCRPSRMGSCIVRLLRREGTCLTVSGLDAFDGTPVLDIKAYVPQFDAFPDAVTPLHWAKVMNHSDDPAHGARRFHWDTTNVEFALGFRAGLMAMERLKTIRGPSLSSTVCGGLFFAQGWEAATGCSPLRGTLIWKEPTVGDSEWNVQLVNSHGTAASASFALRQANWRDAAEVMHAKETELLSSESFAP